MEKKSLIMEKNITNHGKKITNPQPKAPYQRIRSRCKKQKAPPCNVRGLLQKTKADHRTSPMGRVPFWVVWCLISEAGRKRKKRTLTNSGNSFLDTLSTEWRRPIGWVECYFRKRAIYYRALLRKIPYKKIRHLMPLRHPVPGVSWDPLLHHGESSFLGCSISEADRNRRIRTPPNGMN